MTWFIIALASFLATDLVTFLGAFLLVRLLRRLTVLRVVGAFLAGWVALPVVAAVARLSPSQFHDGGKLWLAGILINSAMLYALGTTFKKRDSTAG